MSLLTCANCGTTNRAEARFCKQCGFWLLPKCRNCQAALPEGARFCDQCGTPVQAAATGAADVSTRELYAAQPAVTVDAGMAAGGPPTHAGPDAAAAESLLERFVPDELRRKLEAARDTGGMVGERRIVTMLFCDVKGSTAAAERLDPEDWAEIMNGAFEEMIKPVYRYEGVVARLMGDALLAFFGAPIAHEDDPQRAILAALDIIEGMRPFCEETKKRYGVEMDLRVGINTGLVVVGAVGSDLRMEYSALGDAVNVAARMEQTATPGTVQVAQDTFRLVPNLFEFENLGGVELKGKAEAVPSYRVIGPKTESVRVRGIEGLHASMVGREAELATMGEVLSGLRQGVGRIVLVLGEAGLGKTRLVLEAQAAFVSGAAPPVDWIETPSLSYESNQAYGLFRRMMQRVGGIRQGDAGDAIVQKLRAQVEGLAEQEQARALRVFRALFGAEEQGETRPHQESFSREMYEAVCLWWKHRFASRPTVLVFEDMHWCDAASIGLLRSLLPLTGEMPLLLLCVMRAERTAPAWQIRTAADEEQRHRYTELNLRPLSEVESNQLIDGLLGKPDLPEALRLSILEKAGGNPFFLEEVVRALIDSGALVAEEVNENGRTLRRWRGTTEAADLAIPDNLQALLAARLDRLEEATRGTLQIASVIGRSFYQSILEAVGGGGSELNGQLGTLMRMDLIREAARVPEVEYTFRNPLTQEAVYQTILLKRRRDFHARVAAAIESIYADRLDEMYGLLAHHFALAGRIDRSSEYWRKAAQQAMALFAYEDAIQNLQRAMALLEPDGDRDARVRVLEELGDASQGLRDIPESIRNYHAALELLDPLASDGGIDAVRLQRKIVQLATEAKWNIDLGSYNEVRLTASASRTLLRERLPAMQHEPHTEVVNALATLSFEAWRSQDPPNWEEAESYARAAVAMAEQLGSAPTLSRALGALGNVLDGRSLLREHLEIAMRRLTLSAAASPEHSSEAIDATREAGMALMYVGEYEKALPHLREAEQRAHEARLIGVTVAAIGLQAQCAFRLDRFDEVLALEEKWRDLERHYPRQRVGPTCFYGALSGSVHALRGDSEQARAHARESVAYMELTSGKPEAWQRNQFY